MSPDNQKKRLILAPHLWPVQTVEPIGDGPLFYLSWPGWEQYLTRRLLLTPERKLAAPLLLPEAQNREGDFAAIDQLVKTAGELGAGFLSLRAEGADSFAALTSSIRSGAGKTPTGPILDDRAYLALWTVSEYQARQSDRLLAEAAGRERAMWAALKGEDDHSPQASEQPDDSVVMGRYSPTETLSHSRSVDGLLPRWGSDDSTRRVAYAWQCWRRLAGPLLTEADVIIPTAAEDGE